MLTECTRVGLCSSTGRAEREVLAALAVVYSSNGRISETDTEAREVSRYQFCFSADSAISRS